jgi:hypothetical protein
MIFAPLTEAAAWGANALGPVAGGGAGSKPGSVFFVIVPTGSDGTPGPAMKL